MAQQLSERGLLDLADRVVALELLVAYLASRLPPAERDAALAAVNQGTPPAPIAVIDIRPGILEHGRQYARALLAR